MIQSLEADITNTIQSASATSTGSLEGMMKLTALTASVQEKKKELDELDSKILALEGELKQP